MRVVEAPRALDALRKQARRQREVVLQQRGVAAQVDDEHHEPGWIGKLPQAPQRLLEHRHARLEITLQDQYVRQFGLRMQGIATIAVRHPPQRDGLGIGGGRPGEIATVFPGERQREVREPEACRIAQFLRRLEQSLGMVQGRLIMAQEAVPDGEEPVRQRPIARGSIRRRGQRRLQPAVQFRITQMCRWVQKSSAATKSRSARVASPRASNQVMAARRLGNSSSSRVTHSGDMSPPKASGLGLLGQGQAPGREAVARRIALAAGFQLLQPILAHRLQHAEARFALDPLLLAQQTLVDQRGDAVRRHRAVLSAPATASAASIVQPPGKTASRRKTVCSSGESRSWLQAIVSRIVCCRAGRVRAPPVSSGKRGSSRVSSAAGGSTLTRAAASSMASGKPSSRAQISATRRRSHRSRRSPASRPGPAGRRGPPPGSGPDPPPRRDDADPARPVGPARTPARPAAVAVRDW